MALSDYAKRRILSAFRDPEVAKELTDALEYADTQVDAGGAVPTPTVQTFSFDVEDLSLGLAEGEYVLFTAETDLLITSASVRIIKDFYTDNNNQANGGNTTVGVKSSAQWSDALSEGPQATCTYYGA